MGEAVLLTGVSKSLGEKRVLDEVEVRIREGEAMAIIGHNASGKTTLLNIVSTLWSLDSGEGTILGMDIRKGRRDIRRRVGYVSHDSQLYPDLTVRENLVFFSRLYGVSQVAQRIDELIKWFGIESSLASRVRELSAGMRKRVSIIKSLLPQPGLLLLDEPYANLDPAGKSIVDDAVKAFTNVGTVLLTTHSLEGVPLFVKNKVYLQKGKIRRQDDTSLLTTP